MLHDFLGLGLRKNLAVPKPGLYKVVYQGGIRHRASAESDDINLRPGIIDFAVLTSVQLQCQSGCLSWQGTAQIPVDFQVF